MWLDGTAVDGQQQQKSRATNSNSSLTEMTVTEMDVNGNDGDVDRDEMLGQMDIVIGKCKSLQLNVEI